MPAFCFKTLKISLSKTSLKLRFFSPHVRFLKSQSEIPKTHYSKLTSDDSRLLLLLSHQTLQQARNLLDKFPERSRHSRIAYWTSLLTKYSRIGFIDESRVLFDIMPERNIVSYNVMLSGYLQRGRLSEARRLFEEMPERNVVSWTSMLCGLADAGRICEARENGRMEEARVLFDEMEDRNVITWTTMIAALLLFLEMKRRSNIAPNGETFISLAYACAGTRFHHLGKQLHAQLIINGLEYEDYDGRIAKSLIHMYSLFGAMDYAHYFFKKNLNSYAIQSCNHMINGYTRIGQVEKARNLFDTIPVRDKITWTSMIVGYFDIGNVSEACYLFENMPDKDSVAWTSMISGLVQNEFFLKATSFLLGMLAHGVPPLSSTYAILFGAAGSIAHLDFGRQLHNMLMKTLSDCDLILGDKLDPEADEMLLFLSESGGG
ncbi:hypothetical protein OIU78_014137 [Salix suchowensis]|nr:hypothetical protein OIU78_014137 [Salix suchowensis]